MASEKLKCPICGKLYAVCKVCEENQHTWHSWRLETDTIECYKIFDTLRDYFLKKITKEEAKEILTTKCDISNYKEFDPDTVKQIEEIMHVEFVSKEETSTTEPEKVAKIRTKVTKGSVLPKKTTKDKK